jgi:hypothetical protein
LKRIALTFVAFALFAGGDALIEGRVLRTIIPHPKGRQP